LSKTQNNEKANCHFNFLLYIVLFTNDQWVQMYPEKNFILPNGIQGFDAVLSKDGKTAAAAVFNQESNATDTAYVRVFEL